MTATGFAVTAAYRSGRSAAPRRRGNASRSAGATSSSSATARSAARTPSGRSSTESTAGSSSNNHPELHADRRTILDAWLMADERHLQVGGQRDIGGVVDAAV